MDVGMIRSSIFVDIRQCGFQDIQIQCDLKSGNGLQRHVGAAFQHIPRRTCRVMCREYVNQNSLSLRHSASARHFDVAPD